MHRLDDHFRAALAPSAPTTPTAAESEHGRPPLREGRFRGLPAWFHDGAPGQPLARTEAGDRFDPDDAIACLQFEHYVGVDRAVGAARERRLKSVYYLLKPLLPRSLQLELQRANARRRLREVRFPQWPQDSTLNDLLSALLADRMEAAGIDSVPFVGFWPRGKTWAWCSTHDVDTAVGARHVEALAQAAEERGVRAAWYFVPERYPLARSKLEGLRARGHEIGVHGLQHSGKLFSSRAEFESRRDRINAYLRDWGVVGFRSPATYRNPFWLPELDADYDSSFMDNATLEPQRGGICGTFPFMLDERMVELPITLPMDHTLINVLRQDVVAACRSKMDWVRAQHGLAIPLFHPDYNTTRDRVQRYAAVLDGLCEDERGWYALPHEIASWWQRRRASSVVDDGGGPRVAGPAASAAAVWWAHRDGDRVRVVPS